MTGTSGDRTAGAIDRTSPSGQPEGLQTLIPPGAPHPFRHSILSRAGRGRNASGGEHQANRFPAPLAGWAELSPRRPLRPGASAGSSTAYERTGPGRGVGGLEAHRHDALARTPTPSRRPSRRGRRPCRGRSGGPPGGSGTTTSSGSGVGLAEQVLLDPVGQPGHAHPQQPDAAGGVEVGQQRRGPGERWSCRCRWGWGAWRSGSGW